MDPSPPAGAEPGRKRHTRVIFLVTNLVSLIFLLWSLHGANLGQLRREVAHLHWGWMAFAMITDVLVYVVHAFRWRLVLQPIEPVPILDTIRAIYVGLFANEVLPLRAGELVRCYLLARWSEIPVSVTLASALIERIFDGIWLVACLFLTLHYVHLPKQFVVGGYFLIALLAIVGVLLAMAMYWKEETVEMLVNARWLSWVHVLIKDLHLIGHSRYLYYAALLSLPFLVFQVLPIYAVIRAYDPFGKLGMGSAFALLVILRLGGVIPQAPGNVGTFNGITIIGLRLFGVSHAVGARFSIILWSAVTVPLLVVGFIMIGISGMNMFEIHKHAQAHMRKTHEPVPADVIESPS